MDVNQGTTPQVSGDASASSDSPRAPNTAPPSPATGPMPLPPGLPQQPFSAPSGPVASAQRSPRMVWAICGLAAVLAVAASVMGVVSLTRSDPAAVTTTQTPAAPAFSDKEIAAARNDACAAVTQTVAAVYEAAVPVVAALPNRDSPEFKAALSHEQAVVMVEIEYLKLHTPPATPTDIATPMHELIDATLEVLAADTNGQDRTWPAQKSQRAMDKVHAECMK